MGMQTPTRNRKIELEFVVSSRKGLERGTGYY